MRVLIHSTSKQQDAKKLKVTSSNRRDRSCSPSRSASMPPASSTSTTDSDGDAKRCDCALSELVLSANGKGNGTTFCFGYYHDKEAVDQYALKKLRPSDEDSSSEDLHRLALMLLEECADLTREFSSQPAWVDRKAKEEVKAVKESSGEICQVLPLFHQAEHSLRRRPTQAQVDKLTEIMGHRPRWWQMVEGTRDGCR